MPVELERGFPPVPESLTAKFHFPLPPTTPAELSGCDSQEPSWDYSISDLPGTSEANRKDEEMS